MSRCKEALTIAQGKHHREPLEAKAFWVGWQMHTTARSVVEMEMFLSYHYDESYCSIENIAIKVMVIILPETSP